MNKIGLYTVPIFVLILSFILVNKAFTLKEEVIDTKIRKIVSQSNRKETKEKDTRLSESQIMTIKNLIDAFLIKHNLRELDTRIISGDSNQYIIKVFPIQYSKPVKHSILRKYDNVLAFLNDLSNMPIERYMKYQNLTMGMEGRAGFEADIIIR